MDLFDLALARAMFGGTINRDLSVLGDVSVDGTLTVGDYIFASKGFGGDVRVGGILTVCDGITFSDSGCEARITMAGENAIAITGEDRAPVDISGVGNLHLDGNLTAGHVTFEDGDDHFVSIDAPAENTLELLGTSDAAVELKNLAAPTESSSAATKDYVDGSHRARLVYCANKLPNEGSSAYIARTAFTPSVEVNDYVIGVDGKYGRVTSLTTHSGTPVAAVLCTGAALEGARTDVSTTYEAELLLDPDLAPDEYLAGLNEGRYVLSSTDDFICYADNVYVNMAVTSITRAFWDDGSYSVSTWRNGEFCSIEECSSGGTMFDGDVTVGDDLTVSGTATIRSDTSIDGLLTVGDTLILANSGNEVNLAVTGVDELTLLGANSGAVELKNIAAPTANESVANKGYVDGYAVAKDQGSGNAGKFLVVGNDGNVVPVDIGVLQGGSY